MKRATHDTRASRPVRATVTRTKAPGTLIRSDNTDTGPYHDGLTTLHLLAGLPGSGKTALARRLEVKHPALRLTPDQWMHPLFGAGESGDKRAVLEHALWSVARRVLMLGVDIVLDFGLWSRQESDMYRARAQELGLDVHLYVLDPPLDGLWRRLELRNADLPYTPSRSSAMSWNCGTRGLSGQRCKN